MTDRPCSKCGCPLIFAPQEEGGNPIPLDARCSTYRVDPNTGLAIAQPGVMVSHFQTCPKASEFGKGKKPAPLTQNPTAPVDPVMPFGKHKGDNASACSTDYLDWLIGQDWLQPGLKRQIEDHLDTRADWKRMETEA